MHVCIEVCQQALNPLYLLELLMLCMALCQQPCQQAVHLCFLFESLYILEEHIEQVHALADMSLRQGPDFEQWSASGHDMIRLPPPNILRL